MTLHRTTHRPPLLRPFAGLGATVTAMVVLWRSGNEQRDRPVPSDPRRWAEWATGQDALDVATQAARVLTVLLLAYLAVVALAHLVAAVAPRRGTIGLARLVTPRFLAGSLAGLVALSGASSVGASMTPGRAADPSPGGTNPPVMRLLDELAPSTSTTTATPPAVETSAPAPPPTVTPPTVTPTVGVPSDAGPELAPMPPDVRGPAPAAVPVATPDRHSIHVVAVGEHLWSIAERVLVDRGATTNDPEVAAYWARLIDANRHQLRDPNLILPGQHLDLPT